MRGGKSRLSFGIGMTQLLDRTSIFILKYNSVGILHKPIQALITFPNVSHIIFCEQPPTNSSRSDTLQLKSLYSCNTNRLVLYIRLNYITMGKLITIINIESMF